MIIPASWLSAAVLNAPVFFTIYYDKEIDFCMEYWPSEWLPRAYSLTWFCVAGIIPVMLMTTLYSRVVYSLWFTQTGKNDTRQVFLLTFLEINTTRLNLLYIHFKYRNFISFYYFLPHMLFLGANYMANFSPVSRAKISSRPPEQMLLKDVCDYIKRLSALRFTSRFHVFWACSVIVFSAFPSKFKFGGWAEIHPGLKVSPCICNKSSARAEIRHVIGP